MPLPPALAAKLAKRGLLQSQDSAATPGFVEEVIAESYDDPKKNAQKVIPGSLPKPSGPPVTRFHRLGHYACPNKTNIHHKCVQYCVTRWGRGRVQPDPVYNRRRLRMLKKYPIPPDWNEVYDPGSGRYYYWNTNTHEVCWRSPLHPKAKIGPSAAELRMKLLEDKNESIGAMLPPPVPASKLLSEKLDSSSGSSKSRDGENRYKPYRKDGGGDRDRKRKGRGRDDELDPMDPSSYSDVPRGTWSSGLKVDEDEGITGVDTTASGQLFQMRPYPSPGAILRANAAKKDKSK